MYVGTTTKQWRNSGTKNKITKKHTVTYIYTLCWCQVKTTVLRVYLFVLVSYQIRLDPYWPQASKLILEHRAITWSSYFSRAFTFPTTVSLVCWHLISIAIVMSAADFIPVCSFNGKHRVLICLNWMLKKRARTSWGGFILLLYMRRSHGCHIEAH